MVEIVDKYNTEDNDIIFKDGDAIIRAKIKRGTRISFTISVRKRQRGKDSRMTKSIGV